MGNYRGLMNNADFEDMQATFQTSFNIRYCMSIDNLKGIL